MDTKNLSIGIFKLVLPLFVILIAQASISAQAPPNSVFCANDFQVCSFDGEREVIYGANGTFVRKVIKGGSVCLPQTFGVADPVPNVLKSCYIVNSSATGKLTAYPGAARDIDAKNGMVWVVGGNPIPGGYEISRLVGKNWVKIDGGAARIAVDNTGNPWIINSSGAIYRRLNDQWNVIPAPNGAIPLDIAISTSGDIWIVTDNGTVSRWTGSGWTNLIALNAKRINYIASLDKFQIVDANGKIFVRESPTSWIAATDATGLLNSYSEVAVDTDGTKWVIDAKAAVSQIGGNPITPTNTATVSTNPTTAITPKVIILPNATPVMTPTPSTATDGDDAVGDGDNPDAPRVITTWNKSGYMTKTRVYRLDQATEPLYFAQDGNVNHLAGEHPEITVGTEVPMRVPLQVRVYTLVGIAEAVESYRGTIDSNISGGCFTARGTTMKPTVEPCPDSVAVESRHITFANEAGYTSEMFLDYYVNQTVNGVSTPVMKTAATGITALGYRRKIYVPENALPNMSVTLRIKAYGTNKQDLLTQSFDLTRKESPCFMVKGLPLNPSSELCTGDDAYLTDEKRAIYETYQGHSPILSDADTQKVMKWIAAQMTAQVLPFCWKPIYDNGGGIPLSSCGPGKEREGLLCYPTCKEGYGGNLDRCGAKCPSGFSDIGYFCQKPAAYGRGAGYAWQFGDPAFNYDNAKARCEKDNPQGCEGGLIWYPKCKANFHAVGTNICSPDCPSGWNDTGTGCTKPTYYRGAGEPMGCGSGYEQSGGLCYPACKAGYQQVAANCTLKCPSQQSWDCGAACSTDQATCGWTVADQVISPVLLAVTLATFGATEGVNVAVNEGAKPALIAAKGTARLKNAFQVVKSTFVAGKTRLVNFLKATQTYKGLGANFIKGTDASIFALKGPIVSAIGGETAFYKLLQQTPDEFFKNAKLTVKVASGIKKSINTIQTQIKLYNMLFADNFETMTTKEINAKINQAFPNPIAQYQIKEQWAIQSLGMMASATGWVETKAVFNIASIVDIIGVFGVINAYEHPMCGADVPFPTGLKLLHNQ